MAIGNGTLKAVRIIALALTIILAFTGYIVVFVFFSICISFIVSIILVVMVGMSKLKIIDKQIMFMLLLFMFISVVALMVAMLNIMLELGLQT